MTNLCLIELDSIVEGFKALQDIPSKFEINLTDSSYTFPGHFQLLFTFAKTDKDRLSNYLSTIKNLKDWSILDSHVDSILAAYFAQLKRNITGNSFLISEGRTLSANLKLADFLLSQTSYKLLELKGARGLGPKTLLLADGPVENASLIQNYIKNNIKDSVISFEIIKNPNNLIKSLFNYDYGST